MKRMLLLLPLLTVLLTGCTDLSGRLSPDLLAADTGETVRLAAHTTQENAVITANTADIRLLPDALRNAAGAEISAGHITMLLVCGNPCALLETALQQQWLPPTGSVLALPESACDALCSGDYPTAEHLTAAAETGLLPYRSADTVLGDLWGGSGITALHTREHGRLTLLLLDANGQYGTLSETACRGLALLDHRWKHFSFACGDTACSLRRTKLEIRVTETAGRLRIAVSGTVCPEQNTPAAEQILTDMLTAALDETARAAGADLLFLRERAVRAGVRCAKTCTQAEWAAMLRDADCTVRISVRS